MLLDSNIVMKEVTQIPTVKYSDLELAMQFVTGGSILDAHAYISRETGEIYWVSADSDAEDEIPDNVDDCNRYAEVPQQRELDLGKPLVLKFAACHLPGEYEKVERIFRSKGAYSRYKDLLSERGKLEEWHRFEDAAVEEALIEWAETEGFSVESDAPPATGG